MLISPLFASVDKSTVTAEQPTATSTVHSFLQNDAEPTFYGLASYYNNINYFLVSADQIERLIPGENYTLNSNRWLAAVKRLDTLVIQADGLNFSLSDDELLLTSVTSLDSPHAIVQVANKDKLSSVAPELDQIRYNHLWIGLAQISRAVEFSLVIIQSLVGNWGLAIILFALLLKVLLIPVGIMTTRFQRRVSQVQSALEPKLNEIKSQYDGEEAHNRIMAAHKQLGVSPFYTLKPMIGMFIQIPILIATFNALGEMPQFASQSFFWITDLSLPDTIGELPFTLPLFGSTISILPVIMTVVTLFSTVIFQNTHASSGEMAKQKRNLYLMAAAFFILFYPFPAAMVLYWVMANILQTIQQQIIKI
ncbi:YidC/Oxa1 family membrane protein insertase [Sinobacterium norvegicum]|uniref:YidC/Oxa1 family membrane protein insertase n=1 Tax=Sinobacterium norvegicum TaxID=1641715 RepID=UPI001F01AC91|nr:membrane protein insertase YidC [Sinobacterium norvegicum]